MKAYIDRKTSELITIGWMPEFAREQVTALGLTGWGWIDDNGRAIPASWEEVELLDPNQ